MVERIAILGGGAGSLAAALALTEAADSRDRYQITVYQQGWRLGGKGASSRRESARWRNEEHGLHILGGFYHNAFRLLRRVYEQAPYRKDFDQVFRPLSVCTLTEEVPGGGWRQVDLYFPTNELAVGIDGSELRGLRLLRQTLRFVQGRLRILLGAPPAALVEKVEQQALTFELIEFAIKQGLKWLGVDEDGDLPPPLPPALRKSLVAALDEVTEFLLQCAIVESPEGREPNWSMLAAVGAVCARGVVADELLHKTFASINHEELNAWLARHGATRELIESPYVRAGFDYAFAYAGGITDAAHRSMAAGVALKAFARLVFTYHQALFFHMEGGMGEAVFAPIYDVLRERGVTFRFFHRVERLRLDPAANEVLAVEGRVQTVEADEGHDYDPIVAKDGDRFWPVEPLYGRLRNGAVLQGDADDLECFWAPDRGRPAFRLERGRDFDKVILGISVGALGSICSDLVDRSDAWRRMIATSRTIPVAGVQVWSASPNATLGYPLTPGLVTGYAQPFATWADMSFLLGREDAGAGHLSYFCAPAPVVAPPVDEAGRLGFPKSQEAVVNALYDTWRDQHLVALLPGAASPAFELERYVRANVSPSDNYVLSPPGSIAARLRPERSGFTNLFLAGDWTKNGVDCGAFEAAVMSGLQCARAFTGSLEKIYGEADLP